SKIVVHRMQEGLDRFLVALEEDPLTDTARRDQAGRLQRRQVRGHRRLRQPAALVDLAATDAEIERMLLLGEINLGIFQPAENLAPDRVGQRLVDGIDIDSCSRWLFHISLKIESNFGKIRNLYRDFTIQIKNVLAPPKSCRIGPNQYGRKTPCQ